MQILETMQVLTALFLAGLVALMSSVPVARQTVSSYVADVVAAQSIDTSKYTSDGWRAD